jgi:hypothetical protein
VTPAGGASRLERAWEVVATLAWLLPLLVFVAVHATTPPAWPVRVAIALLALFALTVPRMLGARWFAVRRWEAGGRVYRLAGVRFFGRWVPRGKVMNRIARARSPQQWCGKRLADGAARAALQHATRESERTHLWWLLLTNAVILWAASIGAWHWTVALALLNVLLNGYPVMLQRHTRARLQRIQRRRPDAAAHAGPTS